MLSVFFPNPDLPQKEQHHATIIWLIPLGAKEGLYLQLRDIITIPN